MRERRGSRFRVGRVCMRREEWEEWEEVKASKGKGQV